METVTKQAVKYRTPGFAEQLGVGPTDHTGRADLQNRGIALQIHPKDAELASQNQVCIHRS